MPHGSVQEEDHVTLREPTGRGGFDPRCGIVYTRHRSRRHGAPAEYRLVAGRDGQYDNEAVETTITQLERDWVTAIVKKDAALLDRLLADEIAGVARRRTTTTRT